MSSEYFTRQSLYGFVAGTAISNSSSTFAFALGIGVGLFIGEYVDVQKITEFVKNKFSKDKNDK